MLRILGGVLVAFALAIFVRGGLSFTVRPEQISVDTYVIRHTLILPQSFIIVGLAGASLVVASFLVGRGRKRMP
jgi:hypothetical protein